MKYRTFKRSTKNWNEFSGGKKLTDRRGLSASEARQRCLSWNAERTPAQIARGTKMEFESWR